MDTRGLGSTMCGTLTFTFDADKFVEAMEYLARRIDDLTPMKAAKVLYLADLEHLVNHGRPILGDWYACMPHGPVPSEAYDLLRYLQNPEHCYEPVDLAHLRTRVAVANHGEHARFVARGDEQEPFHLSPSDVEALQVTIAKHGRKSASALRNLTHLQAPWRESKKRNEHKIDYGLFFEESADPERAKRMRDLAEFDQENRDFLRALDE